LDDISTLARQRQMPPAVFFSAAICFVDRVHIHSCGNGHLWFRPYSESLGKTERRPAPSNQGLLPLAFGASLWLGMPSLRSCSVGPPRWAIHGPARLNRHPCRLPTAQNLHSASRWGKKIKSKSRAKAKARRANARPRCQVVRVPL
jgi:hypothetical protein